MSDEPRDKTAGQSTAMEKIRQSHGGALNAGGTRGNKGGRPPSKLRAMCRKMAGSRLQVLGQISSKKSKASDADKIRAVDVLLKYGVGGSAINVADLRRALHEMSELAHEMFPKDQADAFLTACGPIFQRAITGA